MKSQSISNAIVLLVCTGLVFALILPATLRHRDQARSNACSDHLRQLGLAVHNYHSSFNQLPPASTGTDGSDDPAKSNAGRLSAFVALLPFVEQQVLWEMIANPYTNPETKKSFPAMGPVPSYNADQYAPWGRGPNVYRCPGNSEPRPVNTGTPKKVVYTLATELGPVGAMSNYVFCFGDGTDFIGRRPDRQSSESMQNARARMRGMFSIGTVYRFRDVLDGLSSTLMISETRASLRGDAGTSGIAKDVSGISKNPSLCLTAASDAATSWWHFGRGARWNEGALSVTGFQTVLPPNTASCSSERGIEDIITTVSSDHPGGVYAVFADGRTVFVSDTIDVGDTTSPGVSIAAGYTPPGSNSPYGVWGALGSRASKEVLGDIAGVTPASAYPDNQVDPQESFSHWQDQQTRVELFAKFIRIIDRKTIELEDVQNILHQVPLNSLKDEDIYRAIEMDLQSKP